MIQLPSQDRPVTFAVGDAARINLPDNSVDLVLCSPPYEARRKYEHLDFRLRGGEWVEWAVVRYLECLRISRGLVAWVVDGGASGTAYRYSPVESMLTTDLHRAGVHVRRPVFYHRHGTPGSGGPDWLSGKVETVVCATKGGRLPWSDNTACGHPPKFKPGGAMSNRNADGRRINQIKGPDGKKRSGYKPPKLSNPGNVIYCGAVGGGHMGHELASENEAPFTVALAEFFIRSFCPPGGIVCDPFCGSGTTAHAALQHGRTAVLIDKRASQIKLSKRRIADVRNRLDAVRDRMAKEAPPTD